MWNERRGGNHLEGGVGTWTEAVCKMCGKTYMRTSNNVYKGCCSWSCLRAGRRKEEADKQSYEDAMERIRLEKEQVKTKEAIINCEAKIAYFNARLASAKSENARRGAQISLERWKANLEKAKEHLASLQS